MTMHDKPNDFLLLAGKAMTYIAQIGLAFGGTVLAILAPMMLFFGDEIAAEIAEKSADAAAAVPAFPLIGIMVVGVAVIALGFVFFGKLRAIITSVGEGDPFVPENADRLNLMAWLMLGMQVLLIPAGGFGLWLAKWADEVNNADVTIDAGLDLSGILMVVILFILARVFKHGAAMREDLEGTV
ncbi:DUF2975 domain-containing protein [Erythrobacter sp. THAF29]|uniref:DUF2975 domain-containing protein n=1 Tax=Erythrobacter sp. THAF29 TaxID=2587851 RepID=UPI001268B3F5|nr:DUF2975 domain-containing protein [Erythrobacter sp. THAF29]QFT76066.1 hypothetical protein FIU90_00790 [Erythrobacter sp. THAF29]